jgi:hypothetical protein
MQTHRTRVARMCLDNRLRLVVSKHLANIVFWKNQEVLAVSAELSVVRSR